MAVKYGYFRDNKIKFTGKVVNLYGGWFREFVYMEGHKKGEIGYKKLDSKDRLESIGFMTRKRGKPMANKQDKSGLILGGVVLLAGGATGLYFLYKDAAKKQEATEYGAAYSEGAATSNGSSDLFDTSPNADADQTSGFPSTRPSRGMAFAGLPDYNRSRLASFIRRQNELLMEQKRLRIMGGMR